MELREIRPILEAARALISDPAHWTQGEYARDAGGNPVEPDDSEAVCWCLVGALCHVADIDAPDPELGSVDALLPRQLWGDIRLPEFNDGNTHAGVLALLDRAIAACEGVPA